MSPPARLIAIASAMNCIRISQLLCADGSAQPDFIGPFQNRSQHDVHDPDPADQQRDAGDCAHHDIEDALCSLVLFEQLFGNHDRIVIDIPVHDRHQVIDGRSLFRNIGAVGDLYNDFVELIFNGFGVEFLDRRCDGYINIVIGILDFYAFEFLLFR